MSAERAFLLERYRAMDTEELVDLQRKGGLTEVASGALEEVLAERKVSSEQREVIVEQLKQENPYEHLAPLGSRFGAKVADSIFGFVIGIVATLLLLIVSSDAGIFGGVAWFGYLLIADGLPGGQSLGKKFFGTAVVVRRTRAPCGYGRSIVRNLPLLILGLLDVLPMLFGGKRARLGDMIAGTEVVKATPR